MLYSIQVDQLRSEYNNMLHVLPVYSDGSSIQKLRGPRESSLDEWPLS